MCKSEETYRGKNDVENILHKYYGKTNRIAVSNNQKDMKCMLVLS